MKLKLRGIYFTNIRTKFLSQNVDVNKILVSNKVSFDKKGFKEFIGYKDGRKFRLLCVMLTKMRAYRGDFGETKYMSFLIKRKNY